MKQASQSNSNAEPNTKPSSPEVQSRYNLGSNEDSGGDDNNPKKDKPVELPKSHAIDTPSWLLKNPKKLQVRRMKKIHYRRRNLP